MENRQKTGKSVTFFFVFTAKKSIQNSKFYFFYVKFKKTRLWRFQNTLAFWNLTNLGQFRLVFSKNFEHNCRVYDTMKLCVNYDDPWRSTMVCDGGPWCSVTVLDGPWQSVTVRDGPRIKTILGLSQTVICTQLHI